MEKKRTKRKPKLMKKTEIKQNEYIYFYIYIFLREEYIYF